MASLDDHLAYYTEKRKAFVASHREETDVIKRLIDLYFNPCLEIHASRYAVLSNLLEEFGQHYLMPAIKELFPEKVPSVVDWGPGTGWLGYELAQDRLTYVDKRLLLDYTGTYQVMLDLEKVEPSVAHHIKLISAGSDLSIICELLHCITREAQLQLLNCIQSDRLLVVEQLPEGETGEVAQQQIQLMSGQPLLDHDELYTLFPKTGWKVHMQRRVAHYVIVEARNLR